jgi:hypothetical protein
VTPDSGPMWRALPGSILHSDAKFPVRNACSKARPDSRLFDLAYDMAGFGVTEHCVTAAKDREGIQGP